MPVSRRSKRRFDAGAELARSTRSASLPRLARTPASRRSSGRSTIRRQAPFSAGATSSSSPGRRWRLSARARARPTAADRPQSRPGARRGRPRRGQRSRPRHRRRGHRGTLEAARPTVAVLGCGIDRDYPAAHASSRSVAATGLVVSEYAPGVEPAPWRFPARNRIVAGLCSATVVVEARERSGALITADFALEEGREVFAVPGEITSDALRRLERPAQAGRDAADVRPGRARELGLVVSASAPEPEVGATAGVVLAKRRWEPAGADELVRATGLAAEDSAVAVDRARARGRRDRGGGCVSVWRASIARVADSYWLSEPAPSSCREPLAAVADVEVVGGGVTGISCALTLAQAGKRVRLHEARSVASGASGRNGGFALRGGAMAYDSARDWLGHEEAAEYWRLTEAYVGRMGELGGRCVPPHGQPAARGRRRARRASRGVRGAARGRFRRRMARRAARAARRPFPGSALPSRRCRPQPARLVRRLAVSLPRRASRSASTIGSRIWTRSRPRRSSLQPTATQAACWELEGLIIPTRGQMIATEPIPERLFPILTTAGTATTTGTRTRRDGSSRAASATLTSSPSSRPRRRRRPGGSRARSTISSSRFSAGGPWWTHRWAGVFGLVPDLMPVVGRVPGRGRPRDRRRLPGHGNVLGLMCGDLVAQAILRDPHSLLEPMDPARLVAPPLEVHPRQVEFVRTLVAAIAIARS